MKTTQRSSDFICVWGGVCVQVCVDEFDFNTFDLLDLPALTASRHYNHGTGLTVGVPKYSTCCLSCRMPMILLTLSFHRVKLMNGKALCRM